MNWYCYSVLDAFIIKLDYNVDSFPVHSIYIYTAISHDCGTYQLWLELRYEFIVDWVNLPFLTDTVSIIIALSHWVICFFLRFCVRFKFSESWYHFSSKCVVSRVISSFSLRLLLNLILLSWNDSWNWIFFVVCYVSCDAYFFGYDTKLYVI